MTVVTYEEQMIIIHEERLKCEKTAEQDPGYMYDSAGKKKNLENIKTSYKIIINKY